MVFLQVTNCYLFWRPFATTEVVVFRALPNDWDGAKTDVLVYDVHAQTWNIEASLDPAGCTGSSILVEWTAFRRL